MYKDQIFFSKALFNPRVQLGSGIGNFIGNFSSAPSISPEVLDPCNPCRKKGRKKNQMSLQNRFELIVVGIYNVFKRKKKRAIVHNSCVNLAYNTFILTEI